MYCTLYQNRQNCKWHEADQNSCANCSYRHKEPEYKTLSEILKAVYFGLIEPDEAEVLINKIYKDGNV